MHHERRTLAHPKPLDCLIKGPAYDARLKDPGSATQISGR
jgi:hypothetical protein